MAIKLFFVYAIIYVAEKMVLILIKRILIRFSKLFYIVLYWSVGHRHSEGIFIMKPGPTSSPIS